MVEWQGFYSTAQVSRLASIPRPTLYDWKARGIIAPSVQVVDAGLVVDEGYSYADLAIVKLMRSIRIRQLNLRSVAQALRHLYDRFGPPDGRGWENAHVYIIGRNVFATRPDEWDTTEAVRGGQRVITQILGQLFEEEAFILIPREFDAYVEINPNVQNGQPVVRKTRVLTSTINSIFQQGVSLRELAGLYDPIPKQTIQKAIDYERALNGALAPAGTAASGR